MKLAVLGDPIDHSLSPIIHRVALDAAGIDGTYEAIRADADRLRVAVDQIRHGTLTGINVTMPLKEAAFRAVDRVTEVALRTGAVNTVWAGEGAVFGDNTDVAGITGAWRRGGLPDSGPVLVLGAGGAASAALVANAGRPIHLAARRPEQATSLLARTRVQGRVVEWGTPVAGAVVVNATPVGMGGEGRLPERVLEAASGLLDMVYHTEPTAAVRHAAACGLPTVDGITLLVHQAVDAFERWAGVRPPVEAMERAARAAIASK